METIACRSVRVRAGHGAREIAGAGAVVVVFALFPVLVSGLETEGLIAALLGFSVFALWVFASGRPAAGRVLDLVEGAIRIRKGDDHRGQRVIAAGDVEDGYAATPSRIVLGLKSGATVEADLDSERAEEVLDHLEVALHRRALSVRLYGGLEFVLWMIGTLLGLSAVACDLGDSQAGAAACLALAAACVAGAAWWPKPRVVIGLDGVRMIRVLRSTFIPYHEIESVSLMDLDRSTVKLQTTAGTVKLLRMGWDDPETARLVSRIEDGCRRAAAGEGLPLDVLDRRQRPVERWREALRDLALEAGGFRAAGLAEDDLEEVLADPDAPLDRRVGAAMVLRDRSSDAPARIRVAARTSADPRVRIALDAVAAPEPDERAIARALDEELEGRDLERNSPV